MDRILTQRWLAISTKIAIGVVISYVGLVVIVNIFAMLTFGEKSNQLVYHCANNMKILGSALRQYSEADNGELYPSLSPEMGRLMPAANAIHPQFFPHPYENICPIDDQRTHLEALSGQEGFTPDVVSKFLDDNSYFYMGYLVMNDDDMERFADAYRAHLSANKTMKDDIPAPNDSYGARTLYRLRKGIEMTRHNGDNTEAGDLVRTRAAMPVLIERVDNHKNQSRTGILNVIGFSKKEYVGANVLYFDGHVEFIEYPGKWPMTEKTVRILNELDALGISNE